MADGREVGEYVDLSRDAVVIRFRPTQPASVLAGVQKEFRRTGRYGSSVFADVAAPGESFDETVLRLVRRAGIMVSLDGNPKVYVCASAGEISDLNFRFYKDDDDDELPEHYSVDFGSDPTEEDAARFVGPFEGRTWNRQS